MHVATRTARRRLCHMAEPDAWRPACMSGVELALWRVAAEAVYLERDARPCVDCPLSWARERRDEGECNGEPGDQRASEVKR